LVPIQIYSINSADPTISDTGDMCRCVCVEKFHIISYFKWERILLKLKGEFCKKFFDLWYFGRYPAMGSARYRWGAWR